MTIARYLALLSVFMALPSCTTPSPNNQGSIAKWINCGDTAIRDHGLQVLPAVNDCLAQPTNWLGCVIGLIVPSAGITEEAVACATRAAGRQAARATSDPVSSDIKSHADDVIKQRGYQFADDTTK